MKKILSGIVIFMSAIFLMSCDGQGSADNAVQAGSITLSLDKTFILADASDCINIKVLQTLEDGTLKDVTKDADIYVNNSSEPLHSSVFSVTTPGTFTFYAAYDINISEEETVYAYAQLPEAPADTNPSATEFKHRLLLLQHTGTACVNCPRMMTSLRELSGDEAYNTAYTHVACHSYIDPSIEDPCWSKAASDFSRIYNPDDRYPVLTFNFTKEDAGTAIEEIKGKIDALRKESCNVGISATALASDGDLLIDVNVKVAAPGEYRLGVWLLEDDIYGIQSGATEAWHNTHENALRAMLTNESSKTIFVGETMEALRSSNTASRTFRICPESNWEKENCKFMVFVTAPNANGDFDLANSVVCHIGESVNFDYK